MGANISGVLGRLAAKALAGWVLLTMWLVTEGVWGATPPWMDTSLSADQRARLLLAQMSLDEKIAMVHGFSGPYVGNGTNNSRLGIPALHLQDGPAGIADGVHDVTALPAPILLAATWDTSLARQYGIVIGQEARGKGVHVSLGPMINLVRVPQGGRDYETFGEDPYLSGAMAAQHVRGIQSQGVIAGPKHFVCNDQETTRGNEETHIDERTLEEIYYAPFLATVRAGAGSITSAYNAVGGFWCSDSPLLGAVLKARFGFSGFIDCDWGANFYAQTAANNGLDLEMPYGVRFGTPLQNAVQAGTVVMSQLDDMVRRIFVPMFRFGIFDNPPTGTGSTPVNTPEHEQVALATAQQGMVLLKNSGVLPLNNGVIHSIAVSGSVASVAPIWLGAGSAQTYLPYYDTPLDSISNRAGASITITYNQGDSLGGNDISQAAQAAQQADVAIVCVGEQTGEGADRASLSLPSDQDQLVSAVAAANPHTIVVLYEGAGTLMPWNAQVAAAVMAWYPGQDNGKALASILFGDVNPSGKLPVTFPAAANQVPANTPAQFPGTNLQVYYSERLLMGYRWYDASNIAPQYAFGHGLSYTTFAYSNLTMTPVTAAGQLTIGCDVRNTGSRAGAEVAQLYLGFPAVAGEPPRQLKGFKKVTIPVGASVHVTFNLAWEDLAYWDAVTHTWTVPLGPFQVMIGASSRDVRLTGSFTVGSPIPSSGVANHALFSSVTASSVLGTNYPASAGVDGDPETRWASQAGDPQWLMVDLGEQKTITRVRLRWDLNFGRAYQIQTSNDGTNWLTRYTTNSGSGGVEDCLVSGVGRYVRFYGTQSAAGSGYSLQELEVYSTELQITPNLSVRATNANTTVLSWPTTWGGAELLHNSWLDWSHFILEQKSDVASTTWTTVPGSPSISNGTAQFIVPANQSRQFFRLSSPPPLEQ